MSCLVGIGLWALTPPPGNAQIVSIDSLAAQAPVDLLSRAQRLAAGHAALDANRPAEAARVLAPLVRAHPAFRTERHGPAALVLYRAHTAAGDSTAAHRAVRAGINALNAQDRVHPALSDAYVHSVIRHRRTAEYQAAAAAFLHVLERAEPNPSLRLKRHVARTLLLLPEAVRSRYASDPNALLDDGAGRLQDGAGTALAAWWRRQDPRPASPGNERVIQHLQRVDTASRRFPSPHFLGFDDRGRVFVRLGPPPIRRRLTSQSLARSVSTDTHFIPNNEYWRYKAFGRYASFLFVKAKHGFQEASVPDLLPSALRHRSSGSGALAVLALRDLYDVFVPRIPEYGPLFDDVGDAVAALKREASLRQTTVARLADTNFDPTGSSQGRYVSVPARFFDRADRVNREVQTARDASVPETHSAWSDATDTLPVAVRTARFLGPNGAQQVDVFWSVRTHTLHAAPTATRLQAAGYETAAGFRVRAALRRHDAQYRPDGTQVQTRRFPARPRSRPRADEPVFALRLDDRTAPHVSLQWEHAVIPKGADALVPVQTGRRWLDSLAALPTDPEHLVLSDVIPLQAGTLSGGRVRDADGMHATPYPFDAVSPGMPIGVYVEAYHLRTDDRGRTRYTVEVAVERAVRKGGVVGRLGGTRQEETAISTTRTGRRPTAREYLELDLPALDNTRTVTLRVRITDAHSGQTAERAVRFEVER